MTYFSDERQLYMKMQSLLWGGIFYGWLHVYFVCMFAEKSLVNSIDHSGANNSVVNHSSMCAVSPASPVAQTASMVNNSTSHSPSSSVSTPSQSIPPAPSPAATITPISLPQLPQLPQLINSLVGNPSSMPMSNSTQQTPKPDIIMNGPASAGANLLKAVSESVSIIKRVIWKHRNIKIPSINSTNYR